MRTTYYVICADDIPFDEYEFDDYAEALSFYMGKYPLRKTGKCFMSERSIL